MDLLESVHNYFSPNHNDTVIELITVDGKFYFDLTILKYFTRIEHCKIINNKIYLPYLCSEHMTIITKIINHLSVHKTLDDYILMIYILLSHFMMQFIYWDLTLW